MSDNNNIIITPKVTRAVHVVSDTSNSVDLPRPRLIRQHIILQYIVFKNATVFDYYRFTRNLSRYSGWCAIRHTTHTTCKRIYIIIINRCLCFLLFCVFEGLRYDKKTETNHFKCINFWLKYLLITIITWYR